MYSQNQNDYQKLLTNSPPSSQSDQHEPETSELWSSGLCDCCSDTEICCITCWCPWITFGRIAEVVDDGKTSCIVSAGIHAVLTYMLGYGWMYSCMYRSKMRKKYKLDGSPFKDCLTHLCCETCSLCQEYRELQLRGLIMSNDNVEEKIYGAEIVPMAPKGMIR